MKTMKPLLSLLSIVLTCALLSVGPLAETVEAKSFKGGRTFNSAPAYKAPAQKQQMTDATQTKGGFSRGLAGGLLGGAIGGMLFGSLFGMGGEGMGLLPILLLAGGAFFLFRTFARRQAAAQQGYRGGPQQPMGAGFGMGTAAGMNQPPPPPAGNPLEDGLAQIRRTDPGFDEKYFLEIASDVFFQVQAGWMRRDLSSYQHLLGSQLASEYEQHFEEMKAKGQINKLESIAIRKVEIVGAGSDGHEDHVTVLFNANLLDYIVNESGELVSGSMTQPVKFIEKWSWARPVGTEEWRLEGIEVVEE